jgi:predicted nucleic acid-binding protein
VTGWSSWILSSRKCFRRLALQGEVSVYRAKQAVRDLLDLRITRSAHSGLLLRIWQLRHSFSVHEAAYLVLAETLC